MVAALERGEFCRTRRTAGTQLAAGQSCILEGNWRAAHALRLQRHSGRHGARAAQICCRAEPQEIVRRFTSRERHPGHLDALARREFDDGGLPPADILGSERSALDLCSDSPAAYAAAAAEPKKLAPVIWLLARPRPKCAILKVAGMV